MAEKLLTLTEVSKSTGISMPTLQRYKKLYQDRIPSEGEGRTQRYPKRSLKIFRELKKENIGRRGRPRKNPDAPAQPRKAGKKVASKAVKRGGAKTPEGLLTLTEVGKLTGISYPTLLRYVSMHLKKLPHRGTGRARRFLPEAVEVFATLRSESRRGRAPKAKNAIRGQASRSRVAAVAAAPDAATDPTIVARIKTLEKTIKGLERQLVRIEKLARKPLRVTLQR